MRLWQRKPPAPDEVEHLLHRLASIDQRQARQLAEHAIDNKFAARARARVLHPDNPGVADLLAALDRLAATFPLPRHTATGARAFQGACDLIIATAGRARLTGAQRLTLSLAALHVLDPLDVTP